MSLIDKTIRGIAWSTAGKIFAQVFGFVLSIVLARLLVPEDYGLWGMIVVIVNFITLFGELGFGAALIQRKEIDERHLSSVFWLNVVVGVVLAALLALSAPAIAEFYEQPLLVDLTRIVALNFLVAPLNMVQRAIFNREMWFKQLAVVDSVKVVIAGCVAVGMALTGWGVWSLVGQSVTITVVSAIALWFASDWRPSFTFDRHALGDLLGFSANLFGFKTINYWARQVDDVLIGKVMGASALGVYTLAYSTMMVPLKEVTHVLSGVMFPALSKIQDDPARVKGIYLRAISMIALITFPMMLLLWASADVFILTVYGEKWAGAISILEIYCFVGLYQSIGTSVGWLYKSQGRTDLMFKYGLVASILIIVSILIGVYIGTVEAVAISYAIMTGGVLIYPQFMIPGKLVGMRFREVIGAVASIFGCAALAAAAIWGLGTQLPETWPAWAQFVTQAVSGILLYLGIIHTLKIAAYVELRDFIREQLAKKRGKTDDIDRGDADKDEGAQ
ncbi:MOP flippase family protein [Persicimonas caeni]|uniref:MOP flippase family protein n=1 Tax=Persicimonas caeni TaxID=2292766 RepID=A0A4Y6Q202_PERCE|nr:MOP flippase family protein [Persicimonas caeni]QDG54562.1 MOP flippase family protein [Persicimonas caeni]QED35783.1 MOP flippase family protein [Persicimonas caeni]